MSTRTGKPIMTAAIGVLLPITSLHDLEASAQGESCWDEHFTADRCCGLNPVLKGCFDVIYTEEVCCGSSFQSANFIPDDEGCGCAEAAESFLKDAVRALGDNANWSSNRGFPPPMPGLAVVSTLCQAFEGLAAPCPAARLAGHAMCTHFHSLLEHHALAVEHSKEASIAAARLARRRPPFCLSELPRLVSAAFPFSELEAAKNAKHFEAATTEDASASAQDRIREVGWQREWKPQLGVLSRLDELALKYRASPSMRAWQKQWGCTGSDIGPDGSYYSPMYTRIFDHKLVGGSSPGPSRHLPSRILEVGVCDGSGVAVWSEYFQHKESRVVALDLDKNLFGGNRPYLIQRGLDLTRLAAMIECNASDITSEASVTVDWGGEAQSTVKMSGLAALREHGPFEFIRDDASHVASDMIATFKLLFPTVLRPGGVYVIEDTWSYPVQKDVSTSLDASGEFSYFFKLARDALNYGWRYDGQEHNRLMGTAWIQSPKATVLEAWVDTVEFAQGLILIRKRSERD